MQATGHDLVALARTRVGAKYVLGVRVPKNNPDWQSPFDCAELIAWVAYQITHVLHGCHGDDPATADSYTGFWASEFAAHAFPVDEATTVVGAILLRIPAPGSYGHIVLVAGDGETIEAHSTARGVIVGQIAGRRWDCGIFLPEVTYDASTPLAPIERDPVIRVTSPLRTGAIVLAVQKALLARGFSPGILDSIYGTHTQAAVTAFQLSHGDLVPDGEVGNATATALGLQL